MQLRLVAYDLWVQTRKIGVVGKDWWEIHEWKSLVEDVKLFFFWVWKPKIEPQRCKTFNKTLFLHFVFSSKAIHVHCVKDSKHGRMKTEGNKIHLKSHNPEKTTVNLVRILPLLSFIYNSCRLVNALDTYSQDSFPIGCRVWLQTSSVGEPSPLFSHQC